MQGRAILTFSALAAALLALPAGAADGKGMAARPTVLVTKLPRTTSALTQGLYAVSTAGSARPLLDDRWSPVAASSTNGPFAAVPSGPRGLKPLSLVSIQGAATEIPMSSGARCVAFSRDGRFLSFVAGSTATYAHTRRGGSLYATVGALYVAGTRTPIKIGPVVNGVFPFSECPRWSAEGASLAFVGGKSLSASWSVGVWELSALPKLGTIRDAIPSIQYPTFAWAGPRRVLFFDSTGLYSAQPGGSGRLVTAASLAGIDARARDRYPFSLHVNPSGTVLAVSIGRRCGLFRLDGTPIAILPGLLNGWAGNRGALTLEVDRRARIGLFLHPLTKPKRSTLIARSFKAGLVTDPAGAWFAFVHRGSIDFRRSDGSLLRRTRPAFRPALIAGVAQDGRIVLPVSVY